MAAVMEVRSATISGNGTNVLYTVPAGVTVTAQVRYLFSRTTFSGAAGDGSYLKINGVNFFKLTGNSNPGTLYAQTLSLVLGPGDNISVEVINAGAASVTTKCKLFISGFSTP
jgi:hypothetical protein